MDKMKAWVILEEKNLSLVTVDTPKITENDVLIKVKVSCLCNGSDPGMYNGHEAYTPPFIFGHEASGVIIEKGANVTDFEIGDNIFCWCAVGAFAEYQVIPCDNISVFKVPENVTLEESPVLELVIAACRALMNLPGDIKKDSITICGMGPSGLTLVQYAKLLGFKKIVAWDLYSSRRELALSLGATEAYDPAQLDKEIIEKMDKTDVSVDMYGDDLLVGDPTFTLLLRATVPYGTIISYGHPEHGRQFSPFVFQSRNLKMMPPENDHNIIRKEGKVVLDYVKNGDIKVKPLITHVNTFADIGDCFQKMLEKPEEQIKVVFIHE